MRGLKYLGHSLIALAIAFAVGVWLSESGPGVDAHPPESDYGCGFDGDDPCHNTHTPNTHTHARTHSDALAHGNSVFQPS